jgi:hypothetical protein
MNAGLGVDRVRRRRPGQPLADRPRKGHAAVHATGIHGGPSPRLVGSALALAFVFGATVLVAEAF